MSGKCTAASMVLVAALLLIATPAQAQVKPCNYSHTVRGNKRTVSCFAKLMNVNPNDARAIAYRESKFDEWAYNPSGAEGLYQHMRQYWSGRVFAARKTLRKFNVMNTAWYNPRAQAVVTFKMVKRQGGWCPAWC